MAAFNLENLLEFIAENTVVSEIEGSSVYVFTCPLCGFRITALHERSVVTQVVNHLLTHSQYDLRKAVRKFAAEKRGEV